MCTKMEMSVLVFLILLIIQTALAVPVDNNSEMKEAIARSDYVELFKTPIEIDKKLKDLLDELPDLKLVESCRNLTERLQHLINQDLADVKAKTDNILNLISSAETKKKFQDLMNEFSNLKLDESSTNLTERLANSVKQELAVVKAKADNILSHMNLADTKKNLQDILDALSNTNLVEILKRLEKQAKTAVELELFDAKAKFYEILNEINSGDIKKKLQDLVEQFSYLKLVETSNNLKQQLINLVEQELSGLKAKTDAVLQQLNPSEIKKKFQHLFDELSNLQIIKHYNYLENELKNSIQQEFPGVKATVDEILRQIDSAETKKKLQDFLYELSIFNLAEVSRRFEKRLYDFVEIELPGVKSKTDDILAQINSARSKQKMQTLLNLMSNIKLAEISKDLTERLANLNQYEFTDDVKIRRNDANEPVSVS